MYLLQKFISHFPSCVLSLPFCIQLAFQDFQLFSVIIILYYYNLPSAVAGQQQFTYFYMQNCPIVIVNYLYYSFILIRQIIPPVMPRASHKTCIFYLKLRSASYYCQNIPPVCLSTLMINEVTSRLRFFSVDISVCSIYFRQGKYQAFKALDNMQVSVKVILQAKIQRKLW